MLIIVKIWELLTHQQKSKAFVLFFLVLIGGVFESIGLGMILPLIGLMTQPEVILNHSFSEPIVNLLGRPNPEEAFFIVLGSFTALYIIIAIYRLWLTWFQSSLMTNIKMSIASRLFEAYLYQPWTFHLKKHSSSLIQNINKEVDLLAQYGLGGGVIIMRDCIMIIVVMSVFIIASPIEMLTLLILFAPFIWGFQWLSKFRTRKWAGLRQQEERERLKCLQESMGAVKELRLLNCEDLFYQKFVHHSSVLARVNRLSAFMRGLPRPVFETLAIVSMSLVIITMWLSGKELGAIAPIVGLFAIGVVRLLSAINSVLSSVHGIWFVAPSVDIVHK
jgi:ABC-type multidrug transport system fused ATPase/permease subunit